jgi:hypothetical protein
VSSQPRAARRRVCRIGDAELGRGRSVAPGLSVQAFHGQVDQALGEFLFFVNRMSEYFTILMLLRNDDLCFIFHSIV